MLEVFLDMDISKYTDIFIEESKEHLQGLNQTLLEIEKNPKHKELINEIFRIAHTLKGMAATMGYNKMTRLTHVMEDLLHLIRTGEKELKAELIDILFKCLDALENYLGSIINNGNEGELEHEELIRNLKSQVSDASNTNKEDMVEVSLKEKSSVSDEQNDTVESIQKLELDQYDVNIMQKAKIMSNYVYRVDVTFNRSCLLKAARGYILFQGLERHGEIIKSVPSVQEIEDEKFDFDICLLLVSKSIRNDILKEIGYISEIDSYSVTELEELPQVAITQTRLTQSRPEKDSIDKEIENGSIQSANNKAKHGKTVRIDIERLDVLMNLVSELIIVKTGMDGIKSEDKSQKFSESLEYLERITTSLHDAVMKVRMVPVESVFNRFPRMIRDLTKEMKKNIELEMAGEETELDRTVIDEIGDPLIHLLRNAIDHGIDSPEKRSARGKPEKGHIYLRAYPDGNSVVIEVEDDGNGVDLEKIKKKAIEKNLVSKEVANALPNEDIINFLFMPGFSTAETITDLSGRGVGLDVVKNKIETLGGMVEVTTKLEVGTKFTIRMPLTLAIIQALLVEVGKEEYAIPLSNIKEIIKVSPEEIKFVQKREVILLRETILPIVWLERILDVPVVHESEPKTYTVIVVKKGEKFIGVVVDRLIGQQEIVIKSLGKLFSKLRIIAGATILGDGNVALIIDVNSL